MDDPKPDRDVADASLLFGDAPVSDSAPVAKPTEPVEVDGYEIAGFDPEPDRPPVAPIPPPRPRPVAASEKKAKSVAREPSSGVEHVWSRGAEWGVSLVRLGLGLLGAGFLLYVTFGFFLWSILFLAGVVTFLVLAYPIFITLERPVRMTPEQAVKDYFDAFSHLVPHTRRMWLLLATDGRNSPSFRSFNEFDAYWKAKIVAWKAEANVTGPLNPFEIEVVDFKADKSAGMTQVEASYTARVTKRGRPEEPIATHPISLRLVRGSDKMWYLDAGTLL